MLVPVYSPVEGDDGDVVNAPFAPMPASAHLAHPRSITDLAREFDGPVKHDGWPDATPEVEEQCSVCGFVGDMPIVADNQVELELECPVCSGSTYTPAVA